MINNFKIFIVINDVHLSEKIACLNVRKQGEIACLNDVIKEFLVFLYSLYLAFTNMYRKMYFSS